ncbi:glyoxalase family protein [Aspergillus fischeri NRRL 181]|uniref:Glyoxalase family protein n=1 Tax=Neosartorya fischeri (strain ATCC 1020 / DSM 3700 / CBS 544.65 / FGSC A1164 / JCM 1740 / NRRL 181 / WB 181) TaxID=331117 RepID=A1DPH1_NEOFI|nr:glyoxalase family protein [Aspergillus fischeri NRRL 181]EAW16692.1 glyoxalase family protein [Aspergillus fischeri NRRL 181]
MTSEIVNSAWKVIPMFESRSIPLTVDFYTKTLGFELGSVKPEDNESELYFCSLAIGKKADANFYFSKVTPETFKSSHAMIGLGTRQLDDYYVYLKGKIEVEFSEDIEDKPWGFRQFTIKDTDGNSLTFFKFLEGGNPGDE